MIRFEVSPRRLSRCLLILTVVFVLGHGVGLFLRYGMGHPSVYRLVPMFNLKGESNAPTYFSALMLLLAAALLFAIGVAKRTARQPFARHWIFLAIVFGFLSCDEMLVIHERLICPMQRLFGAVGWAYFAWIIPYGIGVIVLGIAYLPFLWSLPRRYMILFLVSGAIYVGGAIGLESASAAVYYESQQSSDTPLFVLWSSLEEIFEMLGMIVFIYALSNYIAEEMQGLQLVIDHDKEKGNGKGSSGTSSPS